MCRRVILVVFWLLIGTRSRLLIVGLLSIAEALCPSRCLFGTILVTLCLMVWDRRVSRAESTLSCWHDLFFSLVSPTILSSSFHGLVVYGWGLWTDVFSLSPGLAELAPNNNNNNISTTKKKLMKALQSFYIDSRAYVRGGMDVSKWFPVNVGLRQGCVMSPWLFNVYMDGVVGEVNARMLGKGMGLLIVNFGRFEIN